MDSCIHVIICGLCYVEKGREANPLRVQQPLYRLLTHTLPRRRTTTVNIYSYTMHWEAAAWIRLRRNSSSINNISRPVNSTRFRRTAAAKTSNTKEWRRPYRQGTSSKSRLPVSPYSYHLGPAQTINNSWGIGWDKDVSVGPSPFFSYLITYNLINIFGDRWMCIVCRYNCWGSALL